MHAKADSLTPKYIPVVTIFVYKAPTMFDCNEDIGGLVHCF